MSVFLLVKNILILVYDIFHPYQDAFSFHMQAYRIVVPYSLLGIFAILIAVWIALFTFISIDEKKKKKSRRIASPYEVQITENMCSSVGKNYNSVEAQFRFAGFSNIHTVPLCDLNFFTSKKNHQVESVSINGNDDFDEVEIFQKSDRVIITYLSQK